MKFPWKLEPAVFVRRPNRFLTEIEIDGTIHLSHLPDPGRLQELLIPGAELLVKRENGVHRKTRFSTQAVYNGDILVSINSWLPNIFTEYLIRQKMLPFLKGWRIRKKEHTVGKSRFDFLLEKNGTYRYLEVKSVTLVENGVARFPDAVTERGRRHLEHLASMQNEGRDCMVLFIVQREDADSFTPQWDRDPKLGQALVAAEAAGVEIRVIRAKMSPDKLTYQQELPIDLSRPDYDTIDGFH